MSNYEEAIPAFAKTIYSWERDKQKYLADWRLDGSPVIQGEKSEVWE